MLKQKVAGTVQEVILPDFPDDDTTFTTTVTKSRRVSFGPNFVKEFIADSAVSAVSAQCMTEYEQPFPSSDSSSADSSHSVHSTFVVHESAKAQVEVNESRFKQSKFASTICFSSDSPTADMEFTEGCITLAKSILEKKNKEMSVFIQAKSKEPKEEEKEKEREREREREEETNYFEGSELEMSMTGCLRPKESKREERRFTSEKTRIFGRHDNEMSMTRCERIINDGESENEHGMEDSKEGRMLLDAIMRHLDKDNSDSDLFNPERSFKRLGVNPFELSDDLDLNESMEISEEVNKVGLMENEIESSNGAQTENSNPESLVKETNVCEGFPSAVELQAEEPAANSLIEDMDITGSCQHPPEIAADCEERNDILDKDDAAELPEKLSPVERNKSEEGDSSPKAEPALGDLKVIENLKEQSSEPGCVWRLQDLQHPGKRTEGLLSFSCRLFESTASVRFTLKMSDEDSFYTCSSVTNSSIILDECKDWKLPEYVLVVGFGFEELKRHFEGHRQRVEKTRHVPYFLDQINSFLSKMNACLRQIYSVLTLYPGSRLRDSRLSFRLFSFPVFFSSVVTVDLSNVFRLSKASLSFEHDFGSLDERAVEEIFEDSLKKENSLCEFIIEMTRYLVELERKSGYLSKRGHIRLLPKELKQ